MADTMIERVARAIRDVIPAGDDYPTDAARAAIEAMREPTEAMMGDGADAGAHAVLNGELHPESRSVGLVWAAMIDAALKEIN